MRFILLVSNRSRHAELSIDSKSAFHVENVSSIGVYYPLKLVLPSWSMRFKEFDRCVILYENSLGISTVRDSTAVVLHSHDESCCSTALGALTFLFIKTPI